jgi:DNA-binding MarR family transcriptional regulator
MLGCFMVKKEKVSQIVSLQHRIFKAVAARGPKPWVGLDLTREQLRIVFLIYHHGELSPGEVADALGVSKANVTGVINRLVVRGLVNRRENPSDRRGYILSLTETGRSQVERLQEQHTEKIAGVIGRMPDEAVEGLHKGLSALLEALEEAA